MKDLATVQKLPTNAPSGLLVLVLLDAADCNDHHLWITRTRSEPWVLGDKVTWVVLLEGRAGGFALGRCFIAPMGF